MCHACQLGHQVRLLFNVSTWQTLVPFEIIHCDIWTSHIPNFSCYKYFLVVLDDFTHFLWTFPHAKIMKVFTLSTFHSLVATQFSSPIRSIQCDNGDEFDNNALRTFADTHGILLRFSYPHTSQQNDKSECVIRTVNDIVRTLLF